MAQGPINPTKISFVIQKNIIVIFKSMLINYDVNYFNEKGSTTHIFVSRLYLF
jgi:hypothetical protein